MLFTASVIDLSDDHRISNGTVRVVYEFPGQPDLFIKVFHSFDDRSSKRPVNDTPADAGGIIWRNVIPGTA